MIAALLKSLSLRIASRIAGAQGHWPHGAPSPAQRIYCANHTSHLDAALLLASLPAPLRDNTRPVAAADYWQAGPLRAWLIESIFHPVLIHRDSRQLNPLGPAFEALRHGDSLIMFPEGTRGPGGSLQPVKPGIFTLARAFPKVEIVPVWIANASRVLPKRALLPIPGQCTLHFGPPLHWDGLEDAPAFLTRLRTAMESLRPQ